MTAENEIPVWKEATYTLVHKHPTLTSLTFREPDGEMLEALEDLGVEEGVNPTVKQSMAMIAIMSGASLDDIRKMHKRDIMEAAGKMVPLLADEPKPKGSAT